MTTNSNLHFQVPAITTSHNMIIPHMFSSSTTRYDDTQHQQHSRKKRSRTIMIASDHIARPKQNKKPDPSAPKITRPCSECGRKFWSWKALFGHMRCHPERQWRGINPPAQFQLPRLPGVVENGEILMTEEDHDCATCLLMLASSYVEPQAEAHNQLVLVQATESPVATSSSMFECSSCKKVFGSHQALGGHRASHKNVKGCFAINQTSTEDEEQQSSGGGVLEEEDNNGKMLMVIGGGHKCSICLRVFSSGQALGGHKRCHWEKGEDISYQGAAFGLDLNLNLPAPRPAAAAQNQNYRDLDFCSSSYSSGFTLDLRLGL